MNRRGFFYLFAAPAMLPLLKLTAAKERRPLVVKHTTLEHSLEWSPFTKLCREEVRGRLEVVGDGFLQLVDVAHLMPLVEGCVQVSNFKVSRESRLAEYRIVAVSANPPAIIPKDFFAAQQKTRPRDLKA